MKLLKAIEARRSFRGYTDKAVSRDVLDRALHAATLAPSCNNMQPWRFLILTEEKERKKACKALMEGNFWAAIPPVMLIVLTKDTLDCQTPDGRAYASFDTGMAVMNFMIQAEHEGLHTHAMAGFDPGILRKDFTIADDVRIITMIAVGYLGDTSFLKGWQRDMEKSPRDRKPMEEVLHWNRWDGERS